MLVSVGDLEAAGPQSLEFTVIGYGSVVVLTAFIYDWILAIEAEVASVQKTRLNLPIIAYYVSRLCSLVYLLCVFMTEIGIVLDTDQIEYAKFAVWWAATSATSLLFFFRIRAVYNHCRVIKYLFSVLWIIIVLSPTAILYTVDDPCKTGRNSDCNYARPLSLVANGTMCLNDTLVFILISHQMYSNSAVHRHGPRDNIKLFFRGHGLYNISKSVLQSGQLYYGVTIGFQLAAMMTYFLGTRFAELVGIMYLAVSSSMACRVFRMVLLCKTVIDAPNTAVVADFLRSTTRVEGNSVVLEDGLHFEIGRGRLREESIPLT